jgi:hypothetical protein
MHSRRVSVVGHEYWTLARPEWVTTPARGNQKTRKNAGAWEPEMGCHAGAWEPEKPEKNRISKIKNE